MMEKTERPPKVPIATNLPLLWKNGSLSVTTDDAVAIIRRPYLSPSSASTISSCPARYAAEKLMPRIDDPFSVSELGTSAHAVLEELYGLPALQRTKRAARDILNEVALRTDHIAPTRDVPCRRLFWYAKVWRRVIGIWDIEDPTKVLVRQREWQLDGIEIANGVPFKGFIDRADIAGDERSVGVSIIDYKGLAVDTPIPTPTGWSTMGEIAVGEQVLCTAGTPTTVTAKSEVHDRPCYRITLSDETSVVCDNEHLWNIVEFTYPDDGPDMESLTVDTESLFTRHFVNSTNGGGLLAILNPQPLLLAPVDATIEEIHTAGHRCDTDLKLLRGSAEQRRVLFNAWADNASLEVDETWSISGAAEAPYMAELARSMGAHVTLEVVEGEARCYFSRPTDPHHGPCRFIVSVVLVDTVPTQCIVVDSEDETFLCGEGMIPTHNSGKVKFPARWGDSHGDQIRLYTAAVEVLDGRKPLNGRIYYTAHGKDRFIKLGQDEMDDTLTRFSAAWDTLRRTVASGKFPTKVSALCGWCPLVTTCPAALAAGKTRAPSATATIVEVPTTVLITQSPAPLPSAGSTPHAGLLLGNTLTVDASAAGEKVGVMDLVELKPWETPSDGSLSATSYAAQAVFGMTGLAVKLLAGADEPINKKTVTALARTLITVVTDAQEQVAGSQNLMDGANTRLRGALHTTVETLPLPFGDTTEAWGNWVTAATKRCVAIANVATSLYLDGYGDKPWSDLGVDPEEEDGFLAE